MIKANELRVGNYISPIAETIVPRKILSKESDGVVIQFGMELKRRENGEGISYSPEPKRLFSFDDIYSIPLTQEIYKKCEFKEDTIEMQPTGDGGNFKVTLYHNKTSYPLFDLHRFQNLYKDLTGTELEIRL